MTVFFNSVKTVIIHCPPGGWTVAQEAESTVHRFLADGAGEDHDQISILVIGFLES